MKKMLNNKVKKIKNKLKKIVRWFYKKKFASMIEPSIIFLKREEFERAAQHDKKIIKYLSKLSKPTRLNRNKKRAVAKIVVQYINLLDAVTIYQQDSMVNNQSLKVYSQSVINGTLDSRVFIPYDWSNFINALMKANARVYNRDTYKYLYDNFVSKYPDMRKARAISQLLWLNVGYIDLKNEIVPLLERFESVMEYLENKGYKRNHKKYDQILYRTTAYISQILRISDMCFWNVPRIEDYISENIKIYIKRNIVIHGVINLIKVALSKDRCIDEAEAFVNKFKNRCAAIYKKGIEDIEGILKEIRTGEISKSSMPITGDNKYLELHAYLTHGNCNKEGIIKKCAESKLFYENKIRIEKDVYKKIRMVEYFFRIKHIERKQLYFKKFNEVLNKVNERSLKEKNTIYFLPYDDYIVAASYSLPVLLEAKKRGSMIVPSSVLTIDFSSDDEELNSIAGSLYYYRLRGKIESYRLKHKCKIDLVNKRIMYDGKNIYQPIYEHVSRWEFSLFMNFESNGFARAQVYRAIINFQNVMFQCEAMYNYAKKNKKKVKIIHAAPQLGVAAAWMIYCDYINKPDIIDFICVRCGRDDYFSLSKDKKSETLTALSLTKNPTARLSIHGTKKGFNKYFWKNKKNYLIFEEKMLQWVAVQRSKSTENSDPQINVERKKVISLIEKYKSDGKKVYIMNGKLIYDLCVKYTKGAVHDDMCDWATDTVKTIKKRPDILLLIKPHPLERDKALIMTEESTDVFRDIILTDLSDNIVYLKPELFRNMDLAPYLDMALVWNSVSALEFTGLGIKTIIGDEWGYLDYPIGFKKPKSKTEYRKYLNNSEKFRPHKDLKMKAIAFLNYISSSDVCIKNPYTQTTTINYHVYDSSIINEEAIDQYIKNGDKQLEKLFSSIN